MRLLIAGWHGQIAHALVELAASDPDITALSVGRPALDLCTPSSIRSTFAATRPDVMINTAAYTGVDEAESDRAAAFDLNMAGAAAFAELARRTGTPVIHLSSGYVFDGAKEGAYNEEDTPSPQTVYGRSKLEGELAVQRANDRHLILRTAWIFSPFGRNFVSNVLDLAGRRAAIEIVDDQFGSPTYAPDLARVILALAARCASRPRTVAWGIYHAAGAGAASWYEVACKALEISRAQGGPFAEVMPIRGADYATAAPRLANSRLDCSKLERAFGIRMPGWEESLADCVGRLLQPADQAGPGGAED
jgi:dTDP-4-dehydrorhamnose reductase